MAGRAHGPLLLIALTALTASVACDQPPTREVEAAERVLAQARMAGADVVAPDRMRQAQAALERARREVRERDYRAALSSANEAADHARAALQAAETARAQARADAERLQAEVQTLLDQVTAARKETAPRVSEPTLAGLDERLEAVQEGQQRLSETLERGDALEARRLAAELKAQVASLAEAYRQARGTPARRSRTRPRPRD